MKIQIQENIAHDLLGKFGEDVSIKLGTALARSIQNFTGILRADLKHEGPVEYMDPGLYSTKYCEAEVPAGVVVLVQRATSALKLHSMQQLFIMLLERPLREPWEWSERGKKVRPPEWYFHLKSKGVTKNG